MDLEAVGQYSNNDFMEIIEIGAYKINIVKKLSGCKYKETEFQRKCRHEECLIVDNFHSYIKPIFHSNIPKKIAKLTHVDNKDLVNAPYYDEVIKDFIKWAGKDAVLVGWSKSDKEMIMVNNMKHYVHFPYNKYIDLQARYDSLFKKKKRTGLQHAITEIGKEFCGLAHNARDDSYNMIPIFERVVLNN